MVAARILRGARRRIGGGLAAASLVALAAGLPAAALAAAGTASTLIRGARVIDGTGAPAVATAVRLRGGRIEAVGDLAPLPDETVVEADGLALAPGFIDTHSHHDDEGGAGTLAAVSQGVTTIVVGQDGGSSFPLADFLARLDAEPWPINVASYAGFGTLRARILGDDYRRPATAAEIAAMRALLREELAAGALGLSSGLEYDPDIYSSREEVLALAREAAAAGGRYISHIRSEDRRFEEAIEEIVAIGSEAGLPVQISHFKLARRSLWGQGAAVLRRLDEARAAGVEITADLYPYEAWQSDLTVLFPDRDFADRAAARYALTEVAAPADLLLTRFDPRPDYAGRTLADVAALRGSDAETALIELIALLETQGGEDTVIGRSMTEGDVVELLRWPHSNVCSDGSATGGHPRGWGAFPRVLGRYVRELAALGLEEAVHKMTGLAAAHVGLAERGVIRPGAHADLVLFDPQTVADRSSFAAPELPAAGIVAVWVNGEVVYRDGAATGARPGRALRRQTSAARSAARIVGGRR